MAEDKNDDQFAELQSAAAPGVTYTRPTSQIDLERRLSEDFLPESARRDNTKDDVLNPEKVNAPYATDDHDTSGYLGVGQEYMQYANDTEKPLTPTEGPEFETLKRLQTGVAGVRKSESKVAEVPTEVGAGSTETLNTAASGESYSAKLVDAPKDYAGGPKVVGLESEETKASAPAPVVAPAPSKATPGKRTSSN